jgi:hydroxyethylthiazole kinase
VAALVDAAVQTWASLPARAPRVHCLTNTVAQPLTANLLLAAGARVSLATHAAEVADMVRTADALLINLGTLDAERVAAVPVALDAVAGHRTPVVLDPVFVEFSALRRDLAQRVQSREGVLIRGNAREMAALRSGCEGRHTWVTTGAIDRVERPGQPVITVSNGHPLMGAVTAVGCATTALIAALCALTDDHGVAALAGLLAACIAAERAAARADGPGDFAMRWIDAVARLDGATIQAHARVALIPD